MDFDLKTYKNDEGVAVDYDDAENTIKAIDEGIKILQEAVVSDTYTTITTTSTSTSTSTSVATAGVEQTQNFKSQSQSQSKPESIRAHSSIKDQIGLNGNGIATTSTYQCTSNAWVVSDLRNEIIQASGSIQTTETSSRTYTKKELPLHEDAVNTNQNENSQDAISSDVVMGAQTEQISDSGQWITEKRDDKIVSRKELSEQSQYYEDALSHVTAQLLDVQQKVAHLEFENNRLRNSAAPEKILDKEEQEFQESRMALQNALKAVNLSLTRQELANSNAWNGFENVREKADAFANALTKGENTRMEKDRLYALISENKKQDKEINRLNMLVSTLKAKLKKISDSQSVDEAYAKKLSNDQDRDALIANLKMELNRQKEKYENETENLVRAHENVVTQLAKELQNELQNENRRLSMNADNSIFRLEQELMRERESHSNLFQNFRVLENRLAEKEDVLQQCINQHELLQAQYTKLYQWSKENAR